MSADLYTITSWLRMLADRIDAGEQVLADDLRWAATLTAAVAHHQEQPMRPVRPWWRRLLRRRIA